VVQCVACIYLPPDSLCAQDGYTPLAVAAKKNHVDVVRYLVEKGANIEIGFDVRGWCSALPADTSRPYLEYAQSSPGILQQAAKQM
jgi:Ankyrin repeats (3 copies)